VGNSRAKTRVLIVGIGGQDARILARLFTEDSAEVWGVSRTPVNPNHKLREVNYLVQDLSPPDSFQSLLSSIQPHFIFHLAAVHGSSTQMNVVEQRLWREMQQCHVEITRNILDWQLQHKSVKSLIALTSFLYTPIKPKQLIDLSTEFRPQGIYGQTKLDALNLIRKYRNDYGIISIGAILFNHSSRYSKDSFLIPSIARNLSQIISNRVKLKIENSEKLLDISKAENFCKGFKSLIETTANQEFIFSSNKLTSIRNLYEDCLLRISPDLLDYVSFDNQGSELPSMYGDSNEISSFINWEGGGDIRETILDIAELGSSSR